MFSKRLILVLLVGLLSFGLVMAGTGCEVDEPVEEPEKIDLGYVMWACAEAQTHVAKAVIMDELGYDVEATALEAAGMYDGVAAGDIDGLVCSWQPVTHADYMEQYGEDLVDLGPNFDGARIGLVVPAYVEIDSIAEMNDYVDEFGGEIQGIDGGAGIMRTTEAAIEDEEYGLDFDLIEASDMAMVAALDDAYAEEEWIVVTGWTPHWKFAEYDLKFLEDPQGTYGEEETINTLVRQGLEEDAADVYNFLDNFYLTEEQLGGIMGEIAEDVDPLEAARNFIENNPDVVEDWLE